MIVGSQRFSGTEPCASTNMSSRNRKPDLQVCDMMHSCAVSIKDHSFQFFPGSFVLRVKIALSACVVPEHAHSEEQLAMFECLNDVFRLCNLYIYDSNSLHKQAVDSGFMFRAQLWALLQKNKFG